MVLFHFIHDVRGALADLQVGAEVRWHQFFLWRAGQGAMFVLYLPTFPRAVDDEEDDDDGGGDDDNDEGRQR